MILADVEANDIRSAISNSNNYFLYQKGYEVKLGTLRVPRSDKGLALKVSGQLFCASSAVHPKYAVRIRDGYSWLSNRFQKGDEVFLVGYSHGAFNARSVDEMISKYGLMKQCKPTDFLDQANPKEDPGLVKLYEADKAKGFAAVSCLCFWKGFPKSTEHRSSRMASL